MASQFKLDWVSSFVSANPNSTGQRASYRRKSVGGAFITTGFTPSNDLSTSANTVNSPSLLDNVVYEFKIEAICAVNGPTINDNGIQEILGFACIVPVLTKTETSVTITLDVTNTDITKARLTLRKSSDNSLVDLSTVNTVSNSITKTVTGLVADTNYYWQVELVAVLQGVEVYSSDSNYLGSICSPYVVKTDASVVCSPVTSIVVTSIEI